MDIKVKKILSLTDEELDKITSWMYSWWGEREGYTPEAIREYYIHSLNDTRLPLTYGLYEGDLLIGTYQITVSDLFVRPDIYPWLANVYISPDKRAKGYGRFLLESVKENITELPFDEIYLFTTHENLYEKYGWEYIGQIRTFLPGNDIQRLYRMKTHH